MTSKLRRAARTFGCEPGDLPRSGDEWLSRHAGAWLIRREDYARFRAKVLSADLTRIRADYGDDGDTGDAEPEREVYIPNYSVHPSGVAIVSVTGTIIQRATPIDSFLCWILGDTCLDWTRAAVERASADPAVSGILMAIDSGGGEGGGISDVADLIRDASKRKRVAAHIGAVGASAAYWLAAGAPHIAASSSSLVGSIGAILQMYDDSKFLEKLGFKEFVFRSDVSPKKWPDPGTDEGAAQIQANVDAFGQHFVDSVARLRGTTPATVLERYGRGDVLMGEPARSAGMIDEVATFDQTLSRVASGATRSRVNVARPMRATVGRAATRVVARRRG